MCVLRKHGIWISSRETESIVWSIDLGAVESACGVALTPKCDYITTSICFYSMLLRLLGVNVMACL